VRMSPPTPDEMRAMKAYVDADRSQRTPFDIIMEGQTPGDDPEKAAGIIRPWAGVGVTWWIEAMWEDLDLQKVLTRIQQGPPRLVK
jgi:hypothetical protein